MVGPTCPSPCRPDLSRAPARPRPRELAIRTALLALPVLLLGLAACSSDPVRPAASAVPSSSNPEPVPLDPGASPPTAAPSASRSSPGRPTTPAGPADPLASRRPLETPPPVGVPPCRPADLTVTDADTVYDPDAVRELFVLRTRGADCQLPAAYPSARLLDGAGGTVAQAAQGGPGLPPPGSTPLTLSARTSLSFFLVTRRDGSCTPAAQLQVVLPGTSTALTAATGAQVCGGLLGVGPVQRLGDAE